MFRYRKLNQNYKEYSEFLGSWLSWSMYCHLPVEEHQVEIWWDWTSRWQMEPGDSGLDEEVSVGHLCYFMVETKNSQQWLSQLDSDCIKVNIRHQGRLSFLPYLREVQKRRVMYSHKYSLFMELTSMLTVLMISEAFLFSFILLFNEIKTSVSVCHYWH